MANDRTIKDAQPAPKPDPKAEPAPEAKPDAKAEPTRAAQPDPKSEPAREPATEAKPDPAREPATEGKPDPAPDPKANVGDIDADAAPPAPDLAPPPVYERTVEVEGDNVAVEESVGYHQGAAEQEVYQRVEHDDDGFAAAVGGRSSLADYEVSRTEAGITVDDEGTAAYVEHATPGHTVRAEAGVDVDDDGATIAARQSVIVGKDTTVSAVEADAHADTDMRDGDVGVRAGVRDENVIGEHTNYVEGEARYEEHDDGSATTTVGAEGRIATGDQHVEAHARHESTTDGDGATDAATSVGADVRLGDTGVGGRYERDTTTDADGEVTSDTTTIGGGVDVGAHEYTAERTTTYERTDDTESTGNRIDLGYEDDAGGSAGIGFEHTERLTETDERDEPDEIDELIGMASGHGGAVPTDHDTTTTVEGHLGDADASVTFNEGRDFDGERGEGWTGAGLGADYTDRQWSSTDATVGETEVGYYQRSEETLDRNPLDGDLEDSSSVERGGYVGNLEARYHNEDYARTDVNPFDGDVSHSSGGSQGVEVGGFEVSRSGAAETNVDLDGSDGSVGASQSSETNLTVGDFQANQSGASSVEAGPGGVAAASDGTVDATGVGSSSTSGRHETDIDASDGNIGSSTQVEHDTDVLGVHVGGSAGGSMSFDDTDGIAASAGGEVDGVGSAEASVGTDGAEASGTFLGVTVGATLGRGGAGVNVDTDGDGESETPGELVDGAIGAAEDLGDEVGEGIEEVGEAIGDAVDDVGDAIEDAAETVGNWLSGDDEDDDDDGDDDATVGEMIDDFLGGFG
ncbi:MAG: hypothetical protein AAFY28_09050 [Actinomycetota bacterium]